MIGLDKAAGALAAATATPVLGKAERIHRRCIKRRRRLPGIVHSLTRPDADAWQAGGRRGHRSAERAGRGDPRRDDRAAEGECRVRAGAAGEEQGGVGLPADDGNAVLDELWYPTHRVRQRSRWMGHPGNLRPMTRRENGATLVACNLKEQGAFGGGASGYGEDVARQTGSGADCASRSGDVAPGDAGEPARPHGGNAGGEAQWADGFAAVFLWRRSLAMVWYAERPDWKPLFKEPRREGRGAGDAGACGGGNTVPDVGGRHGR